jgi:hypothetical protein
LGAAAGGCRHCCAPRRTSSSSHSPPAAAETLGTRKIKMSERGAGLLAFEPGDERVGRESGDDLVYHVEAHHVTRLLQNGAAVLLDKFTICWKEVIAVYYSLSSM